MKTSLFKSKKSSRISGILDRRIKHELYSTVLLLCLIIIPRISLSQDDLTISNKSWDVCTSTKKMIDSSCFYFVTYTFNADGSYNDSRQYTVGNITMNYRGTWKLIRNKLIITTTPENGMSRSTSKQRIIWVDNSTFYTVGLEGV